jgi:hypothetical protein
MTAGIDPDGRDLAVGSGAPTVAGGEVAMDAVLDAVRGDPARRPTAVVAYNDLMAIGALRSIRRRELRVPEDLSIVGFDDVAFAAYAEPALTTIRQETAEMGRWAVATLTERLGASRRLRRRARASSSRSTSRSGNRPGRRRRAEARRLSRPGPPPSRSRDASDRVPRPPCEPVRASAVGPPSGSGRRAARALEDERRRRRREEQVQPCAIRPPTSRGSIRAARAREEDVAGAVGSTGCSLRIDG